MSTILVVDDDALFRTLMKGYLTPLGHAVVENDSGVGVIHQIHAHAPAACLIDIVMDRKEGLEIIMEIATLNRRPVVIAVSSNLLYLATALDLGADDLLSKPFTREALQSVLERQGIGAGAAETVP